MQRKTPATDLVTTGTTPEQAERIRSLYVDHRHSDREIAEALGLHRVTITRKRLALGITSADRRPAIA